MRVADEDEVLDTEQEQTEEVAEEQVEEAGTEETTEEEAGGEEDVVVIGNEEPAASEEVKAAPAWVKDLRQKYRQTAQENAELRAKLGTGQPASGAPQLPAKPKLADYDFDEEKFDAARDAWEAKKREVDAFEANQRSAQEAQQKAVQAVHEGYAKSKSSLKVKDFQEAEDEVGAQFSQVQQSIVMAGTANPALIVYALGKNPKKLQELASIKDPVRFAVAVGKLETEVKVTKRTSTKPAPETTVRGGSGSAPATSATLERLQAEAAKTGDRTKVAAFMRQQRLAGK